MRGSYCGLGRHSGNITISQEGILVEIRERARTGYLIVAGYPEFRLKTAYLEDIHNFIS